MTKITTRILKVVNGPPPADKPELVSLRTFLKNSKKDLTLLGDVFVLCGFAFLLGLKCDSEGKIRKEEAKDQINRAVNDVNPLTNIFKADTDEDGNISPTETFSEIVLRYYDKDRDRKISKEEFDQTENDLVKNREYTESALKALQKIRGN